MCAERMRACPAVFAVSTAEGRMRMGRKISIGAAVSVAAVSAAITVTLTYSYAMKSFNAKVADVNERQAMYTKLGEIDQKARQDYVGKIDEAALTDGICTGYLAGLGDSHSQYLSAKKYQAYRNSADSKSTGVGIRTVQDADGNMEVIEVFPGSPAEKAGVRKGDTITRVGGEEVARITYAAAVNELDGTAGTQARFKILRTGAGASSAAGVQSLDLTVTRGEYTQQMLESSLINGNAAYFKIIQFGANTADDFNSALSSLMRRGAAGIVLDLRDNSGGSMEAAAAVLDTLLPAGNTVTSRDRAGKVTVEYTSRANEAGLPVSVLVNGRTSGAAELFAADVRDFKKGLLVGENTAGNGTKDTAVPLSDGSAMILSTAVYLTPGGRTFDGAGIGVDITKSLDEGQRRLFETNSLSPSDDAQVQTAVSALIRQGAAVEREPGSPSSSGPASSVGGTP